jgi:TonB family protein
LDVKHEKKVEVLAMGRIAPIAFIVFTALFDTPALAQDTKHVAFTDETCAGLVYERKEVSRPAKITLPDVGMSKEALAKGQKVQVALSAVLCRTGRVTDIVVSKGSPDGMTERVVEAIRLTKFTPAMKDGQEVSQLAKFEFRFGFIGERHPLAQGPLEGRIIDSVEVCGYREELKDEIDECMKLLAGQLYSLAGQLYSKEQVEHVWRTLLESGDFDREASKLRIEASEMGGLGVVIELKERPKH